jgi:ferredoxin
MRRQLEVDPTVCDGHGLCAELVPELVELDEWGYPILSDADVSDRLLPHAKRAVASCPVLALKLRTIAGPQQPGVFTAGDPGRRRTGLTAARAASRAGEGFDARVIEPPPHETSLRRR